MMIDRTIWQKSWDSKGKTIGTILLELKSKSLKSKHMRLLGCWDPDGCLIE